MGLFDSVVEAMIRALSKSPERERQLRHALADKQEQERLLEPYGLADWQRTNAELEALRQPYVISLDEFRTVILPALRHIHSLPDDAEGEWTASRLFAFAGSDWRSIARARDALLDRCDAYRLESFIRGVCSTYDVLKRAQREQCPWVRPLWDVRHCTVCRACAPPEKDLGESIAETLRHSMAGVQPTSPDGMHAPQLLEQFQSGHYQLAHEAFDDDGELSALCPGPMLTNLRF